MDEKTAKHLVKIMEDIQKDLHIIASNKEALNLKLDTKGKDIAEAISESIDKQTTKSYSGSNNKSLITAVVDDKSMTVVISTNVGKRIYQLFRD